MISITRFGVLCLLILNTGCINEKDGYLSDIKRFERKFRPTLEQLTDSLQKIKGLDTNYALQVLPKFNNEQVLYYLDGEQRGDYFKVDFELSQREKNLFNDAIIGTMYYYHDKRSFYFKSFYFKKYDRALLTIINKGSPGKNDDKDLEKVAEKGEFSYYLVDAW